MHSKTHLTPLNCRYRIITVSGYVGWVHEYAQFTQIENGDVVVDGIVLAGDRFHERYQSRYIIPK